MLENILAAIVNSTPIFITILLVVILRKRKVFNENTKEGLRVIIFKLLLPFFVFNILYGLDLSSEILKFLPVLLFVISTLLFLLFIFAKYRSINGATLASLFLSVLAYSVGPFAYPFILVNFNGEIFGMVVFFDIFLFALIMLCGPVIGTIFSEGKVFELKSVIKSIVTDIILITVLLSIIINTASIQMPDILIDTSKFIGGSFPFLALVYTSLNLKLPTIKEFIGVFGIVIVRIIFVLITVTGITVLFNLSTLVMSALLLTLIVPFSAFPLVYTSEYKLDSKIIAQLSVVSLAVCLVIYPILIGVIKTIVLN